MTRDRDFVLPEYVTLDRDGENGHNVILLGAPRQGKTYLLKYLTYRACIGRDLYDDDKSNIEPQACIWRARTHDRYLEFFKLGIGILAIPSGGDFTLIRINNDDSKVEITVDDLEEQGMEYFVYDSPQDVVDHLVPGKVICILFPGNLMEEAEFYADLGEKINLRQSRQWVHMVIDEAGDLFPPFNQHTMKTQEKFINAASDFSKNLVNCIIASHEMSGLDWRLGQKFPWTIYKKGATRRKRTGAAPQILRQDYINRLEKNEAIITFGAFYDKFTFPMIPEDKRLDYKLTTIKRTFVIESEGNVTFSEKVGR